MKVKIYVLIDPISNKIRYIGRTRNSLRTRLAGHISKSKRKQTYKDCWINSLIENGLKPIIKLFKIVEGWKYSHIYEQSLISRSIKFGFNLVNLDDRGEGCKNKVISKYQKEKISITLKSKYSKGLINPTNTTKVSVFDLQGNFIKSFNSIAECCRDLKLKTSSVENVLSGYCKRLFNYQITYGENPGVYKKREDYSQNNKPVFLFELSTRTILDFKSYKTAAEFLKVSSPTIRRNLNTIYENYYLTDARLKLDEFRKSLEIDNSEPSST